MKYKIKAVAILIIFTIMVGIIPIIPLNNVVYATGEDPDYYGTWVGGRKGAFDVALTISADEIQINISGAMNGSATFNTLTWAPDTNSKPGYDIDYPNGYEISGFITSVTGDYTSAGTTGDPLKMTVYINNDSLSIYFEDMDVVLYKEYIPPVTKYAVTYNLNGGTGTVPTESDKAASKTFTAKSASGITAPVGKQFKEWNTNSGGTGTSYAVGATVTMPASALTLYAIYEDVSIIPPTPTTYNITSGANGTYKQGATEGLTITSDGDFAKFTGLKINGVILDTSNYTAVSGSTVVTLKASYLSGLAVGTYDIEFLYSDGSAATKFTIAKADTSTGDTTTGKTNTGDAAKTGESNFVILASVIAVLSISGLAVTYIISKKKRA